MGLDIVGWIECREMAFGMEFPKRKRASRQHVKTHYTWEAAMSLDYLYRGRDYAAFACLFGVKNSIRFQPVAAGRGIPHDASRKVRTDVARLEGNAISPSWITWEEVKQIDWEEESEIASRIYVYRRDTNGDLISLGNLSFLGQEREHWLHLFQEKIGPPEQYLCSSWEQEWDLGEVVYRTKKTKRKEIKGAWYPTCQVMEALACHYQDDGVRLVVWFVF